MKKLVSHKIAMIVAVISVGAAAVAAEALGRDGGSGFRQGHFERSSGTYLGGEVLGARMDRIGRYQLVGGLHHYEWIRRQVSGLRELT
jgi:hypothetical protein